MLGDKIKNLRKINKLTQQQLADTLEISRSAVGMVEKNLQGIGTEALIKLSEFFNVSYDFLLNNSEIEICPICRFEYCPLEKEDFEEHKIRHNNFLNFPDKDLFLSYSNREDLKEKSHKILKGANSTISEKADAAIKLYQCWFSRSIDSQNFDINHVPFNEYVAMILNWERSKEDLPEPVYNLLVKEYGIKEGLQENETYYHIDEYKLLSKPEKDIQKSLNQIVNILQNSKNELIFGGKPLDDLTRELLVQNLENSIRIANKTANKK